MPQSVCRRWAKSHTLYNMYGPTEATCGATIKRLLPEEPVTLGHPNPSTRVYILNSQRNFSQPGMVGEIYLAGVQVAKGYLNMAEATSERFMPDCVMRNMEMMYRTGDRGYWNAAGELVCLGRSDRQIKLRGYRLDLDGLETRIATALPSLEGVAVARRGEQLVAMVQPASINAADLRARLAALLPSWSVPNLVLPVARIPCTTAGKTDYKAVAEAASSSLAKARQLGSYPEQIVFGAIRQVLGLGPEIPITHSQHICELGVHSMQQIQLARQLSETLTVSVPLKLVVLNPIVGDLIEAIGKLERLASAAPSTTAPEPHCEAGSAERVTPIESEWLDKYSLDRGSACFNVCFAASFDTAAIDRRGLARAWNAVLARHKMLRCRYSTSHCRWKPVRRSYARCAPRAELTDGFDLWTEANRPFKPDSEHPVRVLISRSSVFIALSHIVADYTTLAVLLGDASAAYRGERLDQIPSAYSDASSWYEPAPPSCRFSEATDCTRTTSCQMVHSIP